MVEIGGIITKAIDGFYYILVDKEEYCCKSRKKFRFKEIDELFKNFPYDVIKISVKHENNIDIIKDKLCNNISCFCGASGVGKSSLLNKIVDKNIMDTSTLSQKVKRGKHTTRFSQLVYIDELDGYLIDTPGFSSVNISKHIDIDNLREYFIEFKDYYEGCKFRGCKHINEIKCNVKQKRISMIN